jgi:phage recombination protein Bet
MSNITAQQGGAITAQTEEDLIRVLQNSLYPGAQIGSVQMVLGYCQAAGLDPMQKPVHIVPMWDAKSGSMRDVVMPGVNLYRTQASRTGKFAGMSEPEYGPMLEEMLGGALIKYPEWCRVRVQKLLDNGTIAEFTAIEYWIENYAVKGGKEKSIAPNAMWSKRPRGQIAKCAEAQALRKAFPECGSQPTAEEMEGKSIGAEIDITAAPTTSQDWVAAAAACKTTEEMGAVWTVGIKEVQATGNMDLYKAFKAIVETRGKELKATEAAAQAARTIDAEPVEPMSDAEIEAADLARTGGAS